MDTYRLCAARLGVPIVWLCKLAFICGAIMGPKEEGLY